MNILLTGHLGFIGSNLMEMLDGHHVIGVDMKDGHNILDADFVESGLARTYLNKIYTGK